MSEVTYAMTRWPIQANLYRDGEYWGCMTSSKYDDVMTVTLIYDVRDKDVVQVRIPERSAAHQVNLLAQLDRRPF